MFKAHIREIRRFARFDSLGDQINKAIEFT